MITAEQEQFIRKYVSKDYFDVERVVDYLRLHDVVGGEIFAVAPLPESKMAHPGRLELLREGFGFNAIDKETFIRRIPFYFYVADYKGNHCGDLKSIISGYYKYTQYGDPNYEEVYQRLERLFYHHKISIVNIMEYTVKQTGYVSRYDIFCLWCDYLDLCERMYVGDTTPKSILYSYNKLLLYAGQKPIVYLPGLVGFNEDFMRADNEIVVGGEFPCDNKGNPVMEWIGVKVENAEYIHCKGDFDKELRIGLTPTTKIYMLNIYNKEGEKSNIWWPIYFGSAVTDFDSWAFKFYRERGGFTQKQVADAVGTSVRTYQKWESGDSIPDGYNLIRLMNILNIDSIQEFIKKEPIVDENIRVEDWIGD